MAKTKQQKQEEAIERKMKHLDKLRNRWIDNAYGTQGYQDNLERLGRDHADRISRDAMNKYYQTCKECGLDNYGNPLK